MSAGTIIAIVVPNVVTALALWLTWKAGERRIAHGRELSDLEAVRDIFDTAAIELRGFMIAIHPATERVFEFGHRLSDAEVEKANNKLGDHGETLDELVERLRIRFGSEHAVVGSLEDVIGGAFEARRALWELEHDEASIADARERVRDWIKESQEAADRFMTAAQRVAGARLPGED